MNILFDPLAEQEYHDAFEFYETRKIGLGEDFKNAIRTALRIIELHPEAGPEVRPCIRKILVNRFPYNLIYSITDHGLYILAVAHARRAPEYWVDRTS
ncbi:type II toxin-antitoxin system RelE/ParE family toxin [Desulfatibacillum aliphaticivorans]|uniref:type II toxin-antitoxin system RelE/ParE family toxin n=1 Tax=Desulfatibacillum aliphaticivorans TaxID=218208 RepID=UPI000487F088|nr:type II toxin-antitoxin system RelE/ParE family toxin [Desulfatibacillum aliphaticivorans]